MAEKYSQGKIYFLLVVGLSFLVDLNVAIKCKEFEVKEWDQEKAWKMECMKELDPKPKNFDEALKNPCFRKCMIMKSGVLNDAGEFNTDKATEMVQKITPKEVQAEMTPKFLECGTSLAPKIKEDKGSCEAFAAVCMCMEKTFMEVCGIK